MVPTIISSSHRNLFSTCIIFAVFATICFSPPSCLAASSEFEVPVGTTGEVMEERKGTEHIYWEFAGLEDFPYYPEEFDASSTNRNPMDVVYENMMEDGIDAGHYILSDFVVGGVNLAEYEMVHPPFELYEDFDIGSYVMDAPERLSWKQLLKIRNGLERPTLSWYVDKVARKRWFNEQGVHPQPTTYFAKYKDELSETGRKEDETETILENLPTQIGFCAKPTHMSMTMGNWLVDIPPSRHGTVEDRNLKYTNRAQRLSSNGQYDPRVCADSLAEGLLREATEIESWALKNVRPGIVIEQLYSHGNDRDLPPHEFCMFVVWGKVYVGQWNMVDDDRYMGGFFYRDGRAAPGCPMDELDDWIPWSELVEIAENLSQHKDMFRVDMFVGVPKYSDVNSTLKIAVSESEIHPTSMFCNPFIAEEMARLWVAGYKIGNYRVIPNDEVPEDYYGKDGLGVTNGDAATYGEYVP
eukprot:jgi/Psemu1/38550/gm1.38550_g